MAREVSPVNKNMYKADGATPVQGEAPGTSNKGDIHFEDLGKLSEFPTPPHSTANPEEGTGEYVVVLCDFLSGAGEHDTFLKGHVRRLSRIIPDYGTEEDRDIIRGRVKRLFDNKAIRLAAPEEKGKDMVAVSVESESESVTAERNRRILLQNENEVLRQKLAEALGARDDLTPSKAGQSSAAQSAAAKSGEAAGTTTDPFDA